MLSIFPQNAKNSLSFFSSASGDKFETCERQTLKRYVLDVYPNKGGTTEIRETFMFLSTRNRKEHGSESVFIERVRVQ